MARFYANECFPLPTVERLRSLGHDVLTTIDVGRANQRVPDHKVLEFAVEQHRAVLTVNKQDYMRLHRAFVRTRRHHHGIVVCSENPNWDELAQLVHAAVGNHDLDGQLVRVNRPAR